MNQTSSLRVALATGGTGGHIFPAEALAEVLEARGCTLMLLTDKRFEHYARQPQSVFGRIELRVLPSTAISGSPLKKTSALLANIKAYLQARALLKTFRPDVVAGFGGYPSLPPMLSATHGRYATLLHEQNALLGKANRLLAGKVDKIATAFPEVSLLEAKDKHKMVCTGNPVRAAIRSLASLPYTALQQDGKMHLLITGGSQGAAIFGDVLPKAVALLPETMRQRLKIVQQVRSEQLEDLQQAYHTLGVDAELAPFFTDIPDRLSAAHLVIARSGASTVAELACAGRPSILVPLPHSADGHQAVNASAIDKAGGGWLVPQSEFNAETLAAKLQSFMDDPSILEQAAIAARQLGKPEAGDILADMVYALASESIGRYSQVSLSTSSSSTTSGIA